MIKRNYGAPGNRLRQLERVLVIIELLSPLRHGATLGEIVSDVRDTIGDDYCERTIIRDLKALKLLGVVERTRHRARGGGVTARWRWIDRSVRAAVFSRMAELRSEERDPWPLKADR